MRRTIVLVFVSVLICQVSITVVEAGSFTYVNSGCQNKGRNYTVGSVYNDNLNSLFNNNLVRQSESAKFYNSTEGDGLDKVYGLFQCREDVDPVLCSACVIDATQKIVAECPLRGEAIVWYYECMLRYANRNIFALEETDPPAYFWSQEDVADYSDFSTKLAAAIKDIIKTAASSRSSHFASNETKLESSDTLYSFAQCTPDIDGLACSHCLTQAKNGMVKYGDGKTNVAVMFPSCQLRYNTTAHSPPSKRRGPQAAIIAVAVSAAAIGVIVLVLVLWICVYRKKPRKMSNAIPLVSPKGPYDEDDDECDDHGVVEIKFAEYDFDTLKIATNDFSTENKLGEGRFGIVYKGTLDNGQQLAIRRLSNPSRLIGKREFVTEAHFLAELQHKNLVRLVGFCVEGDEKLLVYQFMSSSLDRYLFDPKKRPLLDWGKRYKIIIGIAKGLQYLHEDCRLKVIHGDLKPSNILLDKQMDPKIKDIGMSRLFGTEQRSGNTNNVIGTQGYIAPEFTMTKTYSEKSDVYSYGIMLLEIVSGQKNKIFNRPRNEDLPIHVWRLWNEGRSFDITDPALYNNCSSNDLIRCIQIGLLCVQADVEQRPTMSSVVLMLTGIESLSLPSTPAISSHQFSMSNSHNSENELINPSATRNVTWRTDINQDLYPKPR